MKRRYNRRLKLFKPRKDTPIVDLEVAEEFTHQKNTVVKKDADNVLQNMKNNFYRNL